MTTFLAAITVMGFTLIGYWLGYNHRKSVNDFEEICKERSGYELALAELIKEAHAIKEKEKQ